MSGHLQAAMEKGDKVNWLREARGGYGYSVNVAAVVLRIGAKRAQVRIARRLNGQWVRESRWVSKERLSVRAAAVPEVDAQAAQP